MSGSEYLERLKQTLADVIGVLRAKGIQERHLAFGGEGPVPTKRITVPTDARSEFLANRAMGDWAEQVMAQALSRTFPDWKIVPYGFTDRIAAGHPEFKVRYLAGLNEVRKSGKRPDLLIFSAETAVPDDLSEAAQAEIETTVRHAVAAVEVRSSKFEALKYMAVRKEQREAGKVTGRSAPSFTVKVEDLVIVYRWLERHRVPQTYCQVFFDSLFAINFLDIFATIGSGKGFTMEKPAKSQEKATLMIPITRGRQIGTATAMPTFTAAHRVTKLGRHDAYVVPQGGGFELDAKATRRVLLAEG